MSSALAVPALVAGFLIAALALSRLQRAGLIHAEVARKGLHVAMGLACLTFPWVFPDWRGFALAFLAVLLGLVAMRLAPRWAAGGALHAVERRTYGEFYFAAGVAGLYLFARGEPILYVAPLLVLTVADALAAISGVFYGRARYEAPHGGAKTWEGSVVFFFVSFLAIHIPLLLMTDVSDAASLSIALALALLATATEGASWDGLDNLFLPLVLALHLNGFFETGARPGEPFIGLYAIIVLGLLITLAWLVGRAQALRTDALMAMVVFGYTLHSVGGSPIAAGALTLAGGWLFAARLRPGFGRPSPDASAVAAVAAPAAAAAFLANEFAAIDFVSAAALAFSASLGLIWGEAFGAQRARGATALISGGIWGAAAGGAIGGAMGLTALLLTGAPPNWTIPAAMAVGALAGGAGADRGKRRAPMERAFLHLILGGAAALGAAAASAALAAAA